MPGKTFLCFYLSLSLFLFALSLSDPKSPVRHGECSAWKSRSFLWKSSIHEGRIKRKRKKIDSFFFLGASKIFYQSCCHRWLFHQVSRGVLHACLRYRCRSSPSFLLLRHTTEKTSSSAQASSSRFDPTSSFFLLRRGALTRILNRRGTAFWSIEQEEEKRKTTKSHDHQDTHSDSIFWEPIFWKLPFWGAYALHTEDWIAWITNFIYCVTITSYW